MSNMFWIHGTIDFMMQSIPEPWRGESVSAPNEVTFLSPLEYVSARGRALDLFNFDYKWEIYKSASKRIYGPYTMPILYGHQLVGRIDAKVERSEKLLVINAIWMEPWFEPDDEYHDAFERCMNRFLELVGAERVAH